MLFECGMPVLQPTYTIEQCVCSAELGGYGAVDTFWLNYSGFSSTSMLWINDLSDVSSHTVWFCVFTSVH